MFLRVIKKKIWSVLEICEKEGDPVLLEWTNSLNSNYSGSIRRLFSIISQITENINGPTQLPLEISHEANKKHSIYEFIAGDLRILWFYSPCENRVVVCTGHYIKKGRKANKNAVNLAIKLKKQYIEDYNSGKIVIRREGEKK